MMEPTILYYANGNIHVKAYYADATSTNFHRIDGPAYEYYYENGNIQYKEYWINGNLHNEKDAAIIWYDKSGNIESKDYFINNISYSEEQFYARLNNLELFQ